MKKLLFISILILIPYSSFAQVSGLVKKAVAKLEKETAKADFNVAIDECRTELIRENLEDAVRKYSLLIDQEICNRDGVDGVNPDYIAEYAYSLALAGAYEGALCMIDQARLLNASTADFYTAQILGLMSYPELAETFERINGRNDSYAWVKNRADSLCLRYRRLPLVNTDNLENSLHRAKLLSSNGQNIQALVLYQELIGTYPDFYLPHIGCSSLWENLGRLDKAITELEKGLSLMGDMCPQREISEKHLKELNELKMKLDAPDDKSKLKTLFSKKNFTGVVKDFKEKSPSLMLYTGGSFGNNTFSLNGRIGLYTNNKFSASLNMGLSGISGNTAFNLGLSGYKTIKIWVLGLGINNQISSSGYVFSFAPSGGISISNKKGNATYDILLNLYLPVSKNASITYGISIGRTFYFDYSFKGKKK